MSKLLKEVLENSQLNRLKEKLIPAVMDDIQAEMDKKDYLRQLLTTKGKNFPPDSKYLYLIQELTDDYKEKTLLDVIQTSITWNFRGTKSLSYFCKAGNDLIAFAACIVSSKNEANVIYQRAIKKYNGKSWEKNNIIYYEIEPTDMKALMKK